MRQASHALAFHLNPLACLGILAFDRHEEVDHGHMELSKQLSKIGDVETRIEVAHHFR